MRYYTGLTNQPFQPQPVRVDLLAVSQQNTFSTRFCGKLVKLQNISNGLKWFSLEVENSKQLQQTKTFFFQPNIQLEKFNKTYQPKAIDWNRTRLSELKSR